MKSKMNLLFAFLYFLCIPIGYISNLFNPLFDDIYYGHLEYVFNCIVRVIIYIALFITLHFVYKKVDNTKEEKQQLPIKNKVVLYIITFFFITIVSLMSGWQLKPLSDLGEKYTLIQIYDKLGDIAVLAAEIYIMISMFKHFDIFYTNNNFKQFKYFSLSILLVLLTFNIYHLIFNFNIYQLIFIPFTILLGFIYPYTQKSFWKTYLISVLVFLF